MADQHPLVPIAVPIAAVAYGFGVLHLPRGLAVLAGVALFLKGIQWFVLLAAVWYGSGRRELGWTAQRRLLGDWAKPPRRDRDPPS